MVNLSNVSPLPLNFRTGILKKDSMKSVISTYSCKNEYDLNFLPHSCLKECYVCAHTQIFNYIHHITEQATEPDIGPLFHKIYYNNLRHVPCYIAIVCHTNVLGLFNDANNKGYGSSKISNNLKKTGYTKAEVYRYKTHNNMQHCCVCLLSVIDSCIKVTSG